MGHVVATASLIAVANICSAQEPIAHKPVGAPPMDSITAEDSARVDSLLQRHRNTRCWRARPMPECRMVFLTDIGFDAPLYTTVSGDPAARYNRQAFDLRLNWSLGLMRNGDRHSHGLSLSMTSESGLRIPMIAEYRYRQWRRYAAVDAGIGLKRNDVWIDGAGLVPGTGLTTLLGVSPSRWIGASLRYETMRVRGKRVTGVMLGLQSTRVSEYAFQGIALAIVDGLLARIGLTRDEGDSNQ